MDAVKKIIFIFVFIFIFLQFMFFIFSQEILITDNSGTYKWSDGNLSNIQYNSSHISLFYDNSTSNLEFPDYRNENGWINMSKNVLLLHFNEISGAFEDFSGFGNNGSNSGGRYYYQGKLNKSVYFDSDGDQISIPNDASLKLNKFSISFWVKAQSSSSTYNNIVAKEVGNANRNYVVFVPTNGKISGSSSFGGTASTVSYNDSIFDKKWYHIVYQVNESNYQSIYVNGIFRSGLQKGSNLDYGNNNNLLIGNNLFSDDFNGYIDELAIWNMTFSDDEISLIYNTQKKDFELNGTFESPIFNIGENTSWLNLTYDNFPFGQKLPANAEVETSYSSGNINMTDNKLLLYFNESSGDIIDYSGNSNNGTRTGTTLEMEGVIDNSIYFDGASDYISIPTVLDYPNITFVAWVYPNGIKDEANTIFSTKGYDGCTISTSRYGFNFYLETWNNFDGRINVDLGNTATGCSGLNTAKGVIENHKWNHVAFSYNEETDVLKIYKDGVVVANKTISNRPLSSNTAKLGRYTTQNDYEFIGRMDEVALWSRTLSDEEILNIYRRGAFKLNVSARTCDDASCNGDLWSPILCQNNGFCNISSLNNSEFFQFQLNLISKSYSPLPNLDWVSLGYFSNLSDDDINSSATAASLFPNQNLLSFFGIVISIIVYFFVV